jgi:DNA adenine methylase
MYINFPLPKKDYPLLSPLRYPGSKRRLVKYIKDTIKLNSISPKLFVEPFAGGASVAIQLLCDEIIEKIGLSDIDPLIVSFWKCVFFDTEWIINAIMNTKVNVNNFYRYKESNPITNRDRALKCIYLNRTSFSGILSPSAGPLGGKYQISENKIYCRFNKSSIIKRIYQISCLSEKVVFLWQCDWKECLNRLHSYYQKKSDKDDLLIYLDPPFYSKSRRLYNYFFLNDDHIKLYNKLRTFNFHWLLSYDAAKEIYELYSRNGVKPKQIETIYSIVNSYGPRLTKELIITNLSKLPKRKQM